MTFRLLLVFLLLAFHSCIDNNNKIGDVDTIYKEGDINKDTPYNGLIKFYDTATNILEMTANYNSGILEGERIHYYNNGNPKFKLNYEDGKINGELIIFDSLGNIIEKQNIYYDLRVGPTQLFMRGKLIHYYFYSFENIELIHIDYDSIQNKNTMQINDTSFFFWHLNEISTSESDKKQSALFLYLPNPPKLNFEYSLCIIDNAYTVKKTIKEFNEGKSWDLITLDNQNLKSGEMYAIRLIIDNEFDTNDRIGIGFKKIVNGR